MCTGTYTVGRNRPELKIGLPFSFRRRHNRYPKTDRYGGARDLKSIVEPRSFGSLLREYRVAAGLTQETLAERAGMSRGAIAKLEGGTRQQPHRATIDLLAEALSLSPEDRARLERAAHRSKPAALGTAPQEATPATDLPVYFSTFINRENDIAKICSLLATQRLITLVGAGGVGKTRLAVHTAAQFIRTAETRYDGIWFVDLSVVNDRQSAISAIGSSIGIAQCRTADMLVNYLHAQRFMLILDNCEHVLDEVTEFAGELLRRCPGGQILATSRQPLRLDGERVYQVPTFRVPTDEADSKLSLSEALEFSALRLFADRAEAADSSFELRESMVPAIAGVCRRLDGIALAIELAAARTNAFSIATLAEKLDEHLLFFSGGVHGSLSRHKTMHAVFDWSYGLLAERERQVFRRLSIFVGGFTLALATSLWAGEIEEAAIIEVLASLVDKSLVHRDRNADPPRYKMLEPARQYAHEKLLEHAEQDTAARAHAQALLAFAESFDSNLELIPSRVWDAYIDPERDNFRAAFAWSLGPHGDPELGQRLVGSRTAARCGFASGEVQKWTSAALKTLDERTSREVKAKVSLTAARSAVNFENDLDAMLAVCRHALSLQEADDLPAVASAQYLIGAALVKMGRLDQAEAALRQALDAVRQCGAQKDYYFATQALAFVRTCAGDLDEARMFAAEGLRQSRAASANLEFANAALTSAEIEFASGEVERAVALIEEAADFYRSHSNPVRLSRALANLSTYLIALHRYKEARHHAREALRYARIAGFTTDIPWIIQHLAAVALFSNDRNERAERFRRVANLLGFINETARRTGRWRSFNEQQEYDRMLTVLRDVFGEGELATLMEAGKAWTEDHAVAEALAI